MNEKKELCTSSQNDIFFNSDTETGSLDLFRRNNHKRVKKNVTQNFIDKHRLYVLNNDKQAIKERNFVLRRRKKERMKYFVEFLKRLKIEDYSGYFTTKEQMVMNYILSSLANTGVMRVKAESLSEKVACHKNVVYTTIKKLEDTTQIHIAYEGRGHYVFIDKMHANYLDAMKDICDMSNEDAEKNRQNLLLKGFGLRDIEEGSELKRLIDVLMRDNELEQYLDKMKIERVNKIIENELEQKKRKHIEQERTLSIEENNDIDSGSSSQNKSEFTLVNLYYKGLSLSIVEKQKERAYNLLGVTKEEIEKNPFRYENTTLEHLSIFIESIGDILCGTTSSLVLDVLYDSLTFVNRLYITSSDVFVWLKALRLAKDEFDKQEVPYSEILLRSYRVQLHTEYAHVYEGKIYDETELEYIRTDNLMYNLNANTLISYSSLTSGVKKKRLLKQLKEESETLISQIKTIDDALSIFGDVTITDYLSISSVYTKNKLDEKYRTLELEMRKQNKGMGLFFSREQFKRGNGEMTILQAYDEKKERFAYLI